ncbi:hypothetical protein BDA99DRAFT_134061 [Phascolomyces articulosus]|uniref:Uncharacterized protein n=1 Tax=Phascolomyces articulosus TaxID=60185 RepID=A0AAD5PC75_9FUNG|nr:hypothetical protein BDA99DRAFT_134061 [Phascolomyces articulosus]
MLLECRREKLQENDKQKSIIPTTTVTTARRGVVPSARFRTMVTTCQTNGSTQQQEEESVVNVEKKIMTDGTQSSTIPCKKPAGITIATQTTITMDDFLQRQHEQRQRQRCTIKAVIQQKVKYVAIPSTPHICFSSRCSNDQCNNTSLDNTVLTQRRPVVIPASSSDDEYPLQPIDSSEESESEDEQIVSYHPQQPIMPGPPRQEFFPPNRNGGENDLELYDDEEFEHQSPIVVVAPGIVLNNASLEHTENNNGAKRPNNGKYI